MRIQTGELFKKLLGVDDTPHRIALAYSVGVLLAFSPLLGLHTLLGLALAFFFGLSRLAVLIGVYTNNPWTLVPYYTFATWIGTLMMPRRQVVDASLFHTSLEDLLTAEFWKNLLRRGEIVAPFLLGSTLLAVLLAAAAYPLSLALVNSFRRREDNHRAHREKID